MDEAKFPDSQALDSSRNVLIMIQKPLVAFRFRLPNGETRRLQLNFAADSGYEHTVKTLLAATLPIRDKNVQIEASMLSQLTVGSHRSAYQAPCLSRALTVAAAELPSNHKMRPPTIDDHGATPIISASYPRVQSSAGRLEISPRYDHTSRSYQIQLESNQHSQFSAIHQVNQASINVEEQEFPRPSSTSVALADMSVDMLSQILPPKRDLPFAVAPAKRPRPVANRSSTVEESPTSVKAARKSKEDRATGIPKQAPKQRAKPKSIPSKPTSPEALVKENSASTGVAAQEATLDDATPKQALRKNVTPQRCMAEKSTAYAVVTNTPTTYQNTSATVTVSESRTRAFQEVLSQSLDTRFREAVPRDAPLPALQYACKDVSTQTSTADALLPLAPKPGNTNTTPHLEISQEWWDRVDEHMRMAEYQSLPRPVSTPATVLADRLGPECDLQAYVARPGEERQAGLSHVMLDAIMDENFVTLCEDVEKVLEGMLKSR
ncbi:hypothetical protein MMC18_005774 [Xylographa bjoerkii]|nr:hypothetical protein [Xylographa bjoerkii]